MAEKVILDRLGKPRVRTVSTLPSMTVQSDAHLADINNIMAQFKHDGVQMLDDTELEFKDVSEFTDYHDLMNEVREAETVFMRLPSKVREEFGHDVTRWLDTAHDQEKRDAMVAKGLIKDSNQGDGASEPEGVSKDPPTPEPGGAREGDG